MKTYFKKTRPEKPGTPIPLETRMEVWERAKGRCEYCGKRAIDPHHIVFRSRGGSNDAKNLVALCRVCHEDFSILLKILKNPALYIGRYKW